MATSTNAPSDVLHSANHSQLSAEEIAKAVARHNHKHPNAHTDDAAAPKGRKRGK